MRKLELKLKNDFNIVFSDSKLLETAFTHTSYANENHLPKTASNERLEFLGDAALSLTISEYLYLKFPEKLEGELSKIRSSLVRTESLSRFSKKCHFDEFIKLGNGEEQMGGRCRDTTLEDLFESFLGALLLDQGFEAVKKFLNLVVIPDFEDGDFIGVTDYKTALQELLQVNGDTKIEYRVIEETGPDHKKQFKVAVFENELQLGSGHGHSKKLAEQAAAQDAFKMAIRSKR
ncbi:MAG TPA: ribonuclease III [Lactovum miscens]|uniref:ribonuclease III n=1 Tax=Lactovum miscens TaxID=190387 RepID=UPI002EDA79EA